MKEEKDVDLCEQSQRPLQVGSAASLYARVAAPANFRLKKYVLCGGASSSLNRSELPNFMKVIGRWPAHPHGGLWFYLKRVEMLN